jgi:competence protein ComEC
VLHKEIPFLRIVVPLCSGIVTGMYYAGGFILITSLIIIITAGLSLSIFYNSRVTNYLYGVAVSIGFFTCGLILIANEKAGISILEPAQKTFQTIVTDYPAEKENSYMVTLKLEAIAGEGVYMPVKGSILIYHRKDSLIKTLKPGDLLTIACTPLEIGNRGNPYEFDYKSFMASKGIRYYAFTGKKNLIAHASPEHRKLKYKALIIRERIIKMYEERGISGERLALVSAITLGQKNLLDPEMKQIFINAGIMHIMAVSGLHAVILSLFIFKMLFFLKGRLNILRVVITIVLLWAFAFVTGLSPSVLRATLMFSFFQAGNLMNRKVNGINSVLASAFVLIIIRPSVITDAGFLLSYAAVIYIIGFYQDLYNKIQFKRWLPDKIWQSVVVTIVAQAGTLPLTIMLFNRFPVYFIITNVIIVPLSSLLIILGCLVPLTYPLVAVSEFLASILDRLTGLTEFLTSTAASLPYSTIDKIGMIPAECILLTVALALLVSFLLKNQQFSIKYPVVAFILLVIALNIRTTQNRVTNELIVYNNLNTPTTGIQTGNTLQLLSYIDSVPAEVLRHAATKGLKINPIKLEKRPYLFKSGSKLIMITDSLRMGTINGNKPDILILTGTKPYFEKNIPSEFIPEIIIVSAECYSGFKLPLTSEQVKNRTIRYVRKSGAYIAGLLAG